MSPYIICKILSRQARSAQKVLNKQIGLNLAWIPLPAVNLVLPFQHSELIVLQLDQKLKSLTQMTQITILKTQDCLLQSFCSY